MGCCPCNNSIMFDSLSTLLLPVILYLSVPVVRRRSSSTSDDSSRLHQTILIVYIRRFSSLASNAVRRLRYRQINRLNRPLREIAFRISSTKVSLLSLHFVAWMSSCLAVARMHRQSLRTSSEAQSHPGLKDLFLTVINVVC